MLPPPVALTLTARADLESQHGEVLPPPVALILTAQADLRVPAR